MNMPPKRNSSSTVPITRWMKVNKVLSVCSVCFNSYPRLRHPCGYRWYPGGRTTPGGLRRRRQPGQIRSERGGDLLFGQVL